MTLLAIAGLLVVVFGIWWLTRKRHPSGDEVMELSRAENRVKMAGSITRGAQLQRGDHPERQG